MRQCVTLIWKWFFLCCWFRCAYFNYVLHVRRNSVYVDASNTDYKHPLVKWALWMSRCKVYFHYWICLGMLHVIEIQAARQIISVSHPFDYLGHWNSYVLIHQWPLTIWWNLLCFRCYMFNVVSNFKFRIIFTRMNVLCPLS